MERINLAPGGMSGIGTARMIHGYVAKIHDNPSDEEFSDYGGTIDVGEYPDETASAEPVIHKGVLLSAATNSEGGFLIVPALFSDVTIFMDAATRYAYVVNFSHVDILRLNARTETVIGVHFNSHIDGHKIFMGPEQSMQIQSNLASTIAMAFDECPSSVADRKYMTNSVERTTRWLKRCKDEMARLNSLPDTINPHQMLFGINQGGIYEDIRIAHAQQIAELNLDGYAVGGLAVGESHEEMYRILDAVVPHLPENKPTYLMGVGTPANILEAVDRGVDFFDCVYPSRNGRHGHVYTNHGKMNLFNAKYELDDRPIEEGCNCPACRSYSRAYIRHLLKAKEMLGMRLCVLHNLYFYNTMMEEIRDAIDAGEFQAYKKRKLEGMEQK